LSIKAKEVAEEKEAMREYGSSNSGASLGDILGAALRSRDEAAQADDAEADDAEADDAEADDAEADDAKADDAEAKDDDKASE
jgi:small subunit ribosomal protein S1